MHSARGRRPRPAATRHGRCRAGCLRQPLRTAASSLRELQQPRAFAAPSSPAPSHAQQIQHPAHTKHRRQRAVSAAPGPSTSTLCSAPHAVQQPHGKLCPRRHKHSSPPPATHVTLFLRNTPQASGIQGAPAAPVWPPNREEAVSVHRSGVSFFAVGNAPVGALPTAPQLRSAAALRWRRALSNSGRFHATKQRQGRGRENTEKSGGR